MAAKIYTLKPVVGMPVAFKPAASPSLAGIAGRVSRVIAHLADGDYLVAVEYPQPVKFRDERLTRIDALASLLEWAPA